MLAELYKYALDNNIAVRPGFRPKNVRYYISLGAGGEFIGIDTVSERVMCPDIGSLANSTSKSNIAAEKAEVILNIPDINGVFRREQKHRFYMDSMKEAARYDPLFDTAVKALEEKRDLIADTFLKHGKPGDIISIKVDGKPLESSTGYLEWWEQFRKSFGSEKNGDEVRCFITGELTKPMRIVPPVSGLISVGGNAKGDSLICFDKDAFRSYGFERAANAAVSETAMTGVNMALEHLLANSSSLLAGAKNIHWFSEEVKEDIIELLDHDIAVSADDLPGRPEKNNAEDDDRVRRLYKSIFDGDYPVNPKNKYYMLSLSGVNGRIMIRSYDEGYYSELYKSIRAWYEDLSMIYISGKGYCRLPKLRSIYMRLLKFSDPDKKTGERISKELAGISPRIIYSVFHNTPLPDTAAVKALAYIRHDMYSSRSDKDRPDKQKSIDAVSCQILKAWLNRKYRSQNREEFLIMDKLNNESPSKAYHVGRLVAVFASIQNRALNNVGAGIVEKYYTSACTSPALVIGRMSAMSQHHLSKLASRPGGKKTYNYYVGLLQEISRKIGTSVPNTFTLEEQSEFALGFYFQSVKKYSPDNNEDTEE